MSYGTGRLTGAVRVMAGVIASAIVSAAFLAGLASPAAAQGYVKAGSPAAQKYLKTSSPADGGAVGVAPSQVVLEFTGPIRSGGYRMIVLGPSGTIAYQQLAAQIAGDTLTQPLRPLGPAGVYRVEFHVVAADGLPLTGEVRFTLTRPGPAAALGARARTVPITPALASVNNAQPWELWMAGALGVLLVTGAVLFSWRVTRDLD